MPKAVVLCYLCLASLLSVFGCSIARAEPPLVAWRCDEIVVVGRATILAKIDRSGTDEITTSDRYRMNARVRKVVHGKEPRRVIPVVGWQLKDRDVLMVLRPDGKQGYEMTATGSKAAKTCER